jgi:hypothetical protein
LLFTHVNTDLPFHNASTEEHDFSVTVGESVDSDEDDSDEDENAMDED